MVGALEGVLLRIIDGKLVVVFNVGHLELGFEVVTVKVGGLVDGRNVGILDAGIKKSIE